MSVLLFAVRALGWTCPACSALGVLRHEADRAVTEAEAAAHVCTPSEVPC